jgi:hypothetical protein
MTRGRQSENFEEHAKKILQSTVNYCNLLQYTAITAKYY